MEIREHLVWGYAVLIAGFENSLREYAKKNVLIANHGSNWKSGIPIHIQERIKKDNPTEDVDLWDINQQLESLHFIELNEIIMDKENKNDIEGFFGDYPRKQLSGIMIELYEYRNKIAHIKKTTFTELDFIAMKDLLLAICLGPESFQLNQYIRSEGYRKYIDKIPETFFEEYRCVNNLPKEDYDLDGGFVGRGDETRLIIKHLCKERPHIVTIIGSGGVGKTAIALQVAYKLMNSINNPFEAILWFSAKTNKLTDNGIISVTPNLEDIRILVPRILKIIDSTSYKKFRDESLDYQEYYTRVIEVLGSTKCLLIIDNLETRYQDQELIDFLGDIPGPSMVLITSRKGLGEYEKRIELHALPERDAVKLFRLVCIERNLDDLVRLDDKIIVRLVRNVLQYPLLIKWSIGQVVKGRDVEDAFSEKSYSGDSDIARFSFDDIFSLLTDEEKLILFSMVTFGEKPITVQHLLYFTGQTTKDINDSIQQLLLSSLLIRVHEADQNGAVQTMFNMLSLTRAYVDAKLDIQSPLRQSLESKAYRLQRDIEMDERSKSEFTQSLVSFGVKTEQDKIAYQFVKAAKKFAEQGRNEDARKNFESALEASNDFGYALIECSKFLFEDVNKRDNAFSLAEYAVKAHPDNFQAWWNLGVLRKKNMEVKKSIEAYKEAFEKNPTESQLMIELGRVYSFDGQFEMAMVKFNSALTNLASIRDKGMPFPKQETLAYQFRADAQFNWGINLSRRGDFSSASEHMEKAAIDAEKAFNLQESEKHIKLLRQIHREAAIIYAKSNRLELSKKHIRESIRPYNIRGQASEVDQDYATQAYIDVINAYTETGYYDPLIAEEIARDALQNVRKGTPKYERLRSIVAEIVRSNMDEKPTVSGLIVYYDPDRRFGKIESGDNIYFFFKNCFKKAITDDEIADAKKFGVTVYFSLNPNPKKEMPDIASNIVFRA